LILLDEIFNANPTGFVRIAFSPGFDRKFHEGRIKDVCPPGFPTFMSASKSYFFPLVKVCEDGNDLDRV